MLKGLVPFIKSEKIDSICRELGGQIKTDYKNLEPILICPLKGSIFFFNRLIEHLDFPLEVDFVSVARQASGLCRIRKDIHLPIEGRHILIVEEIVDTGRKIHFLKERLLISRPASVKTVSLLDKSSRRALPVRVDYVGLKVDDRFVVGCGMDADELGRNYRDIYIFAQ